MFNWFWDFLYSISEILFAIIDGMLQIANKLCGIEPIEVAGQQTDFLSYLLGHQKIWYGLIGAVLIGIFLLMIFSVIAICRSCVKEGKQTPAQIAIHVFKTLGLFIAVPILMIVFTLVVNELMKVLYTATRMGNTTMGEFLFRSFLPDDIQNYTGTAVDWHKASSVRAFMKAAGSNMKHYKFFFSWIVCLPLVVIVAIALLHFVDRTLSIVILYIVSPIVLSTTVLDEGQHFKLWRDQVLVKYLCGYGIIISLNVYILVISIISSPDVKFFSNGFLNFLLKMAFALGGGLFMMKIDSLIGNLVSQGAGDAALRNSVDTIRMAAGIKNTLSGGKKDKGKGKDKENDKKDEEADSESQSGESMNTGNSANNNKMDLFNKVNAEVGDVIRGPEESNENHNDNQDLNKSFSNDDDDEDESNYGGGGFNINNANNANNNKINSKKDDPVKNIIENDDDEDKIK